MARAVGVPPSQRLGQDTRFASCSPGPRNVKPLGGAGSHGRTRTGVALQEGAARTPARSAVPRRSSRGVRGDRKSTRLNSSHGYISYADFCLNKKQSGKVVKRDSVLEGIISTIMATLPRMNSVGSLVATRNRRIRRVKQTGKKFRVGS